MMFADKLDFLMKLTGTQNSVIGRAAHVDASTVSRLRTGKRELPKRQSFLPLMCQYFARGISTPYQKRSAADAACPGQTWPEDRETARRLLLSWLTEESSSRDASMAGFVSNISSFSYTPVKTVAMEDRYGAAESGDGCYYGNAGKRRAVIRFLSRAADAKMPGTLLLYSDESMDWLNEDPSFVRQWAYLMQRVIQAGNRIRIVHAIGRTLDEMLEALKKWIGVYMSGAVEPYYCPKLRDGITRRTLFVFPGSAAVCASSVGVHTQDALNFYTTNAASIHALEMEFQNYLELCVPLMRIFTKKDRRAARDLLCELLNTQNDTMIVQRTPSLATMPDFVARQIGMRCDDHELTEIYQTAANAFRTCVGECCVCEAFSLIEASDFREGEVAVSAIWRNAANGLYYTRKEYAAHLRSVLDTLETYENYCVFLPQTPFLPENMAICHKAQTGTILARTDDSPAAFAINESRMNAALNEYLMMHLEDIKKPGYRKKAMAILSAAIRGYLDE